MKKKYLSYAINSVMIVSLYIFMTFWMNSGFIDRYYTNIILVCCINVILTISLNLVTGFLGELALGHAGFMAVGAYTAALATMKLNMQGNMFMIALILGGIMAALAGIIVGVPALRLEGDYLAIITLGFGEIIRIIIQNLKITGGARGLKGIPELTNFTNVYWVMIISIVVLFALINTRHGRAIISIRENLIASEASGIPTTYYKVFAFTIAAFFAGVAGGLFAHYGGLLDPSRKVFGFDRSIEILIMVVLGGMGSLSGSIIAAVVLTVLMALLSGFAAYRMIIYSVILIIVMIFRPSGLMGGHELSIIKLYDKIAKRKPLQKDGD